MTRKFLPAQIVEFPTSDNGYAWLVKVTSDKDGVFTDVVFTLRVGLGAPNGIDNKVGDTGTLCYRSGPSSGLWFWSDKNEFDARMDV